MDIFGRGSRELREDSGVPLAFSHSVHQQAGILEVFLALTFRGKAYMTSAIFLGLFEV